MSRPRRLILSRTTAREKRILFVALLVVCLGFTSCGQPPAEKPIAGPAPAASDRPAGAASESNLPGESIAPPLPGKPAGSGSTTRHGSHTRGTAVDQTDDMPVGGEATSITLSTDRDRQAEIVQDVDPRNDGWDTEVFAENAGKQLKKIGLLLEGPHPKPADRLAELITPDFSCSPLRPGHQQTVLNDGLITVTRGDRAEPAETYSGVEGLAQALGQLRDRFRDASDVHVKFKLFRVTRLDEGMNTAIFFEAGGLTKNGPLQVNATWHCRWRGGEPDEVPKLSSISVSNHEEVTSHSSSGTLFSDCTESIFEQVAAYDQQLRFSIDYWRGRVETYLGVYFDGHHGLALGDVNGDGLDDLYICEPGGLPNRLFLQSDTGSLQDISVESGVDFLDHSRSALLVDLDNDGDQDLVLSMENRLKIFSNDGQGRFRQSASLDVNNQKAYSLSAADFDQDGDIDIYACFYHGVDHAQNRLPDPLPYHDARTGGPNRLFRNDGLGNFIDATDAVGLDHNNDRWSFALAWEDIDNDGDQDLYVANDFGRNNLYRNDNGKFTDVAGPAGAEDQNFGMSVSFGDYNRDGWMDLYVSNMFSSAGGRVSFQPDFQKGASTELKAAYQRLARGNTLLENVGAGLDSSEPGFLDVSEQAGITMGRWAWGSLFADINNDGWEDVIVANGYVTGKIPDDL